MAQSLVDCCNSALQKLGATSILALTDNSLEARQCGIAFDSNRRSELRKHRWNFSVKRVVLSPDATAPEFDFLYQFTIPSDCLKILFPQDYTLDWVLESGKILTNAGAILHLRYISDVTDVTKWDPIFYDAAAISLAMDLCERITNSASKKAVLEKEYEAAIAQARRNNAFENLPADPYEPSFVTVRW